MRFRLRSLSALVTLVAVVCVAIYSVLHIDDPYAVIEVSNDPTIDLTQDVALELTERALRLAGLEPIRPEPYRDENDPERYVGRNGSRPKDELSVIWAVRGGSFPTYTVRLERTPTGIVARVGEDWL